MSSQDDSGESRSPAFRLIHHYREQAMGAVHRYNQRKVTERAVGTTIQQDLATAALNYYYALYEFRDAGALQEEWDDRGVAWLEEAEGQTVTVEESVPRANGATKTVEKPLLRTVSPQKLKRAILELNDIANELGFSAEASGSSPRTEITDEMIEKVEEWQQRNLE